MGILPTVSGRGAKVNIAKKCRFAPNLSRDEQISTKKSMKRRLPREFEIL